MAFVDMLDDAMYAGRRLKIATKSRGIIVGKPDAVDEYDTDPDRLGYSISFGDGWCDTVFLDEITGIEFDGPRTTMQEAM